MHNQKMFVHTLVNSSRIREEEIDGEPHIVVPASTLPIEGIVMNGVLYNSDVILNSYKQLENTPAPLGHPVVDGKRVSASDPRAMNAFGVGAYNRNVHVEDGLVRMEKVINKRIAESSSQGRALLKAIYDEQPIHTSTGLDAVTVEEKGIFNSKTYNRKVAEARFDHDCFLIDEEGAATPDERVGVFVNSISDDEEQFNLTLGEPSMSKETESEKGLLTTLANAVAGLTSLLNKADDKEKSEKKEPTVEAKDESKDAEKDEAKDDGKSPVTKGEAKPKSEDEKETKETKENSASDETKDEQEKTPEEEALEAALNDFLPKVVDVVMEKLKEEADETKEGDEKSGEETITNSNRTTAVLRTPTESISEFTKSLTQLPD